jgi:hypothetical protein
MPKFPKSTKIQVRLEDALLPRIPEQGQSRDKYINDAVREKLDGPDPSLAAKALRSIPSERRSEAARENGKKGGRPRNAPPPATP